MLTLVGHLEERESELDALLGLIRSAAGGSGAAVLVEGEAGIGKTALLAEASERAASDHGMVVLSARAGELERDFAWGVVRQLFDAAVARAPAAERARLLEGAAALAAPALGIEAGESAMDVSYAALHGLYWLTVNVAQASPLVLFVDDLHWADAPSLRFIAHLLPRIAELPVLLLLASRPRGSEPGASEDLLAGIAAEQGVTGMRLAALSEAASAVLVRRQLAGQASDEVCLACHELTGGNPFLLRALASELAGEDGAPGDVTAEHVRRMTPEAVSSTVLLRLARLSPEALGLARAAAILGAGAPLQAAARLAGLEVDDAATSSGTLIRAGILAEDDTLTFVHPLVRTAVYQDLAAPERSRWHHRAARLLAEDNAPVEGVAAHLVQSNPGADEWTVEQLRRGAADAWTRGAPDVAADYLRRALAEPPSEQSRGLVRFELAQIELVHDPAAAVPGLREALGLVTEPGRRAEVTLALGDGLSVLGRLAEAVEVLSHSIAELEGEDAPALLSSLEAARLGAARWEPTAQKLRGELVAAIREREARGEPLDPRLQSQLAIEACADGVDLDAAVRAARATLAATERPTGAATSALPEAMLVLAFADHAEEARVAIEDWVALARSRAWPLAIVFGSTVATLAAVYRGAVSEAVASARGAVAPDAEIRLAPITIAFLVEALIERGQIDEARAELAVRGLADELPGGWATTPLLLARGRLHAAAGDHQAAVDDLLATGERAEAWGVRNPAMQPWRSSAAVSLAHLGDRRRAIQLADEEVELARAWGAPRAIGVALCAAGVAHGSEQGLALLQEAVDVLESSSAPLEHARALMYMGAALRRAKQRPKARDYLRAALDLAHQLGGVAVADRAREELVIAGARPRRDALRGRDALTASELRVAQLAASGRTNREIAEALFVTLRTVEAHLTSSYGKLGISSRQELPAALAETGLATTPPPTD
ncbi:MAG TPA: AAA family ATPase [Thermoleophilaceae bacterium]